MTEPFNRPVVCPTLIGRTRDLAALQQLVTLTKSSQGRVALICGEAGIGKSRLVAEAKTYASGQGFLLLQGNCFQTDSSFPYAPLRDLLRTHLTHQAEASVDLAPFIQVLSKLLPDLPLLLPHLMNPSPQAVPSDPVWKLRSARLKLVMYAYNN